MYIIIGMTSLGIQHHRHQSLPPTYHKSQTSLTTPQAPIITTNLPQVTDKPYNTTIKQ